MQKASLKVGRVKVRTLDISAKSHQDGYGNSYFTAIVTLNAFLPSRVSFNIPYTYGYGDHYVHTAFKELAKRGYLKNDGEVHYWQVCRDLVVELRANVEQVKTMKEVKRHIL